MFFSAFLAFLASRLTVTPGELGWSLLAMALLYPAALLIVQRRFGSAVLPLIALLAFVAYAAPVAVTLGALPASGRLVALVATSALAPSVLPVAFATAAIWRLTRDARAAAPAMQLAGGVVAYLAGLPVATLATALAAFAM